MVRKYEKSETVIRRSEESTFFMIILSGSVEISRITMEGYKTVFRHFYSPSAIGYSLLAGKQPTSADIIANELTLIAMIPLGTIQEIFRRNSDLLFSVISHFAHLVNSLSTELLEQRTLSLKERIFRTIQRDCNEQGEMKISHEELAQMVGATRANVSRALKNLEKESKICLDRRKISLQNPPS
jgi:CRP-like cAMP-binding protein